MQLAEFQRLEQIKALYKQITPSLLVVAISVYTLSFIVLWPVYDKLTLTIWYVSGGIITVLRRESAKKFLKQTITIDEYGSWSRQAIIWAFLSGISWGFIYVFFASPDHFFRLLILLGVFSALITLSAANFGMYFPVYFAFSLPSTLLFFGKIIYIGGELFYIAGALVVAFFIEMTSIALTTQKAFNRTSELHFFNNKLMREVVTQKETAENAVHAKNQFLAAASHDLRQPLHAQGLFIDAMLDQNLSPEADEIVSKIQLSTEALNSLLNSLLDISRLDADSVEYTPQHMPLSPMLNSIIQEYLERANENGSNIVLNAPKNLAVYCDEALLYRLIRNLIDNAVKFTENGSITICAKMTYKKVTVTISDTGKGIPDNQQDNVFTEFTQLDNPERDRQKGLGLGLAIVKRLSKLMDVPVSMESSLGKGTTFSLALPSSINSSIEIQKNLNRPQDQIETTQTFNNHVILVIDDEAEILEGMQYLVETWQAKIITATDTEMAVKTLTERKLTPTLILADFRLRDNQNGIDAISIIREHFGASISAILVTGDTSPDRLQLALSANLTVLHKPVNPQTLRKTVSHVISEQQNTD